MDPDRDSVKLLHDSTARKEEVMTSRPADTVLHTADLHSWLDWRDIYGRTPLSLACTVKPPLPLSLPLPLPLSPEQQQQQGALESDTHTSKSNNRIRNKKNKINDSRNNDNFNSNNNDSNGNDNDNDDAVTGCCGCIPGRRRNDPRHTRLTSSPHPTASTDALGTPPPPPLSQHNVLPASPTGTPGPTVLPPTGTPGPTPQSPSTPARTRTPVTLKKAPVPVTIPIHDTPVSMVRTLMRAGADVSVVNAHTQYSPLMEAAEAGK